MTERPGDTLPEMSRVQRLAWWGLLAALISQGLGGYAMAFGFDGPLFRWHQNPTAIALWGDPIYSAQTAAYRHWIQGAMGATLAAWSTACAWLCFIPLRRGERWAWWAIVSSLLAWYPLDTTLSLRDGVWINAAVNTAALTGMVLPLAVLWHWLSLDRTET